MHTARLFHHHHHYCHVHSPHSSYHFLSAVLHIQPLCYNLNYRTRIIDISGDILVQYGVLQGSVTGPRFLLPIMNDFLGARGALTLLSADDVIVVKAYC